MKKIPHASVVGSLMYDQVYIRPDMAFAMGMLGRYQSNLGMVDWKDAEKVLRYLKGTKDYMLIYRRTNNLEIVGYCDLDYIGCNDSRQSTSGHVFMLAGGSGSWRNKKAKHSCYFFHVD